MSRTSEKATDRFCENMSSVVHEAFKRMRTNVILALPKTSGCKVVGITSAQPGEGKSTTAINLAYTFAELGKRTLLIDADMHRPSIGAKLRLDDARGLSDLLTNLNDIKSALIHYKRKSDQVSFDVLCSGAYEKESELLSSPRFTALLDKLRDVYDLVILDLPPVGAVIDAVIVGRYTDGMVVIARENVTPKQQFENCMRELEFAEIKILGLVFNGSLEGSGKKYAYKYSYY